jgi:hypothetical protein
MVTLLSLYQDPAISAADEGKKGPLSSSHDLSPVACLHLHKITHLRSTPYSTHFTRFDDLHTCSLKCTGTFHTILT